MIVADLAALERRDPPAAGEPGPAGPESARRRSRERAVAELRAVAPAGHSFGRRGR